MADTNFDKVVEQAQKALELCNAAIARAEAAEERVRVLEGALKSFVNVTARMKEKGAEINWQNVAEAIIEESQDVLDRAALTTTGVQHG